MPASLDAIETPPIDHWSIGRPQTLPTGLQSTLSLPAVLACTQKSPRVTHE
jgi:hypothetical protein